MSGLYQPGLVGEEDGWGIAGTGGTGLCVLVDEGGRKMENVKEVGWVLDAFIFQHIPILHNSKVNALEGHLTKTSSSLVKRSAIDQLFLEMWRQLI